MTAAHDLFLMEVALDLARRGVGRTSPNPVVGCVVARHGQIVGRGYHRAAGGDHAEIHALRQAGDRARGADLFVTLEPCCHHGRTPPCVDAVIAAEPARVVVAMRDPNPRVAGHGVAALRRAGIAVQVGVREAEAQRLNESFCLSVVAKRSFVHLKLAATLDGKIATRSGDSRWISCAESRQRVHQLRDRCGVVAVGVGTAVADDPRLTARLPECAERPVLRVILDPSLRTPLHLQVVAAPEGGETLLACSQQVSAERVARYAGAGVEVVRLPSAGGSLDLSELLSLLYARGHMEILVEGGAETARSFLDQRLVDRLHLFTSLRLLGGRDAVSVVGGDSPQRIADAWRLQDETLERVGADLYLTARPCWE